jgi:putative endonuclease
MKSAHYHTGKEGEAMAADHLQLMGYTILHCNWRFRRYETDIIAVKEERLHFIEVKTRRGAGFGRPEESISAKKLRHMLLCAAGFQRRFPGWKRIQFDVLSITLGPDGTAEYFFIEDVYL